MDIADSGETLLAISEDGKAADVVAVTTLDAAKLMERQHLQEWIVAHPEILGSGVKIVAVEYGGMVVAGDPQRDRLDVLGLDVDGRLVVVELKRGIAPDTVEMQALKYAAMASRFSLETLADAYAAFCVSRGTGMTSEQAGGALQAHAAVVSEQTLRNPRVVLIAQGFSPVVISSVVFLAEHGVDLTLIRFQPYQHSSGQVFVTFSQLYPLLDLDKSIVGPGPKVDVPTDKLPTCDWTVADLVALGRVANLTTRTTLELCADKPDVHIGFSEVVETAGVTPPQAKGQLAGLTMVIKSRFGRRNWPFKVEWAVGGVQQIFYSMSAEAAGRWRQAAQQLDVEQSDSDEPESTSPSTQ